MTYLVRPASALAGAVEPPGDKSISHRALILNSIAGGLAEAYNCPPSADILATVDCLKALGVNLRLDPDPEEGTAKKGLRVKVTGRGIECLSEPDRVLDAGNSGTTMRLLTGLLSAAPFFSVISGDSSLNSRPMERLVKPLRLMGAEIWGREGGNRAPLSIQGGRLSGIEYSLPVASAQIKSALIIAGLCAQGDSIIHQPASSRDHTERMVQAMGASLTLEDTTITVRPGPLSAVDAQIPGDISSAAYWLVAGAIHPDSRVKVVNTGVNPTRTGVIEVLRGMGARVMVGEPSIVGGEPVADISVESSQLESVEVKGDLIPRIIDELPLVALAATQARGTTEIRDAGELRVKESDRIQTTVQELKRLGADIEELPDGMKIRGPTPLQGTRCNSRGDHRLAMTLGVAGLIAKGETTIEGAEAVNISYPGFWNELERLKTG
ncbi:MAG: 3-phosphoshikimate 1-carboxyvinyltransferase [Dehalococcoidia bacterium]